MPKYADLSAGHVRDYYQVTPDNDTDNVKRNSTDVCVGFYIGGTAGNLSMLIDGNVSTIPVLANQYIPCTGATRVRATSTTATPIYSCLI